MPGGEKDKTRQLPSSPSGGGSDVLGRLAALGKRARHAVLATESGGRPYASLVSFSLTPEGDGVVFATPKATRKYKNILRNPNVSVLIDDRKNTEEDYLGAEAVTLTGRARVLRKGRTREKLSSALLRKHPGLSGFVCSPGVAVVLVEAEVAVHVTRFQHVSSWHREGAEGLRRGF